LDDDGPATDGGVKDVLETSPGLTVTVEIESGRGDIVPSM
jgi:hypothetical protein